MQNSNNKIAVIGSANIDLTTFIDRMPVMGETLEAPRFEMNFGGKGANQAVAAAKLGGNVMMVARVGDDHFANNTIDNFNKFNMDITHVEKVAGLSSGVAPIFVDKNGSNSILIVKGANNEVTPAVVDKAADDLKQCKLIILQLEIPINTIYYVIEFAKDNGIEVLLNPAPAYELDMKYVNMVDFFVPNEVELGMLTKMPSESIPEIEAAAKSLIDNGVKNVITTIGSRGSMWMDSNHKIVTVPICGDVSSRVKDTTGAGDSYIGCFSHYYVNGTPIEQAMEYASIYSGLSVTGEGAQNSYYTKSDFENFLNNKTFRD